MSKTSRLRGVAHACALLVVLLTTAPAFADDAERVTPKTIWDGTLTVNGLIQDCVMIVGFVVSVLAIVSFFEKKRVAAETKAEKKAHELREDQEKKDERFRSEARERDERMMAEFRESRETLEKRVAKTESILDQHTVGFMPKTEIAAAFDQMDKQWRQGLEHEKGNRIATEKSLQRLWEKSEGDIRQIMVEMGGLKQQQVGTAAAVDRIETKLDKVQECLNTLSRKV